MTEKTAKQMAVDQANEAGQYAARQATSGLQSVYQRNLLIALYNLACSAFPEEPSAKQIEAQADAAHYMECAGIKVP